MNVKPEKVPQNFRYIVFGYIGRLTQFDINKLSIDILYIIVLYYYIHFKFYTKNCGKYSIINIYIPLTLKTIKLRKKKHLN